MDFRILGPLEVVDAGREVHLGGPRQRALLALLLLEANRPVSRERLINALWEDEPTATAPKALQVYVSQLRKSLGKDRLQTKSPGYLLRVGPGELDLDRFEELRRDGKHAEALGLWRGQPLEELANERFAQADIARLEELRLSCLEERIERDLASGGNGEVIGELERLAREWPLRERFRAQLMLALYRSGRQAESLAVYASARHELVEGLGIEPGRELRELHQAILNQEPSLERAGSAAVDALQYATDEPGQGERPGAAQDVRKRVAVLVVTAAALAPFGRLLDPEAVRWLNDQILSLVEDAVVRHGGVIDAVSDESIAALFGLPAAHEDDALRAIRAGVDARDSLRALTDALAAERALSVRVGIGISTGEVVAGGTARRSRATGAPLREAAELAAAAADGEILFDEGARLLARHAVTAEASGEGWRLSGLLEGAAPARRFDSPMVGRARERRRLQDAFEQAVVDGSCQLFTVLGIGGVGKSRLVHEFLDGLDARARVARGRCLPYGEGITYWPLLEAVKDLVGLDDGDSAEAAQSRLTLALGDEPDAEQVARRVAETVGLTDVAGVAEEGFAAVRRLLETITRGGPLVVVFDDIHWGEPTFLDLIEYLAEWMRDAPTLLVCLARPELLELRPVWGGGKLNATVALLEPLSNDECSRLVENLVGAAAFAEGLGPRIAEAADGNPLFVEEMLSMLIDDGTLARRSGRWVVTRDLAAVPVPATIQALLSARLDQLGEHERTVIGSAAVAGKVFQQGAVVELVPPDVRPDVAELLNLLVRKELIRPERASLGEPSYRFRHLLIRDAAYESLPKAARAELHERFARWLERSSSGRATEYQEVLGYHLERAYRCREEVGVIDQAAREIAREAADRLGSAGRRALLRSDAPAGVNLISRAASLLPADDRLRVELIPNVRVVQGLSLEMSWADRVLTEAVEAAATSGDRSLAAHALVQRGFLRLFTEPDVTPAELLQSAERALTAFEELGDELGQARAWRLKAQAHYLDRCARLCADASEQALRHVRAVGDDFEEREIVEWLVIALFLGPEPAPEAARRSERLRTETPDPLIQAMILVVQAALIAMQGDITTGEALNRQARTIMAEHDEWIWIVSFWWSFIEMWQSKPDAAERELRPGYEALKKIGSKSHFSSFAHLLASALYEQGRYDEAEQLTRECENAARPNDVHSYIGWRSIRAKILARHGLPDQAEQLAREAITYAATTDFHPAHADALVDLAEVHTIAANPDAARTTLTEAIRLYGKKGNTIAANRASAHLHRMRSEASGHQAS